MHLSYILIIHIIIFKSSNYRLLYLNDFLQVNYVCFVIRQSLLVFININ
jgi:hypothetical protein